MKLAPVREALSAYSSISQAVVHTGQHYDWNMSAGFFEVLGLPEPDVNLEVGSDTHARQTAQVMVRLEEVLASWKPDLVLVYGDVNSTLAGALVCAKMGIRLGHVEAGLRSFDRTMPEEINRLVTDRLADLLFTPSADADENLVREGVLAERIHRVGNVMIDSLVKVLPRAKSSRVFEHLGLNGRVPHVLVTLHRPSNVDDPERLGAVLDSLEDLARDWEVVFPVHPRTRAVMERIGRRWQHPRLHLTDPLSYVDFIALQQRAAAVITDSGGVQEESTYLGVPCFTLRRNTERPVTIEVGTNTLMGDDLERLRVAMQEVAEGKAKRGRVPDLWDGKAAERIAQVLEWEMGMTPSQGPARERG